MYNPETTAIRLKYYYPGTPSRARIFRPQSSITPEGREEALDKAWREAKEEGEEIRKSGGVYSIAELKSIGI